MYFSALLTLTYLYGVVGTSNSFQASLLQPGVRSHLPYSQWMAKSIMARHEALDISPDLMSSFIFKNGMFRLALERLIDHVEDTATKLKYFDYIKAGVDNEITAEGQLKYYNPVATHILDDLLLGHALIYLQEVLNEPVYGRAAAQLRSSLDSQPRTGEGMYWYRADKTHNNLTYPNTPDQAFIEQIYMLAPFYVRFTTLLDIENSTAVHQDVLQQFGLFQKHCEHVDSHLYAQGYDDTRQKPWADPVTGRTPELWGRANGWAAMAMVDTLELLPISHTSTTWQTLLSMFVSLANAVVSAADEATGAWWQVMSWPGREGNFLESSASGMFVYALYKGVRLGYLEPRTSDFQSYPAIPYLETARKGFKALVDRYVVYEPNGNLGYNGTVMVRGLGGNFSYEFYIDGTIVYNDLEGATTFVMAAIEHEKAFPLGKSGGKD